MQGRRGWVRLHEKGGKEHEVPCHHSLEQYLDEYIASGTGIKTRIGNHTFQATGVTAYLKNKGTLEAAQHIADHESPRTTKLTTGAIMRIHSMKCSELRFDEIRTQAQIDTAADRPRPKADR